MLLAKNTLFGIKKHSEEFAFQVFFVALFLIVGFLLEDNMGNANEVNVLPFVRQYVDSNWIPNDVLLNQPAGYRLPFIILFGHLTTTIGFLGTSLIGRLVSYTIIAFGLVFLGRKLGLTLLSMLVAIGLFVYIQQGVIAHEWVVGGIEPKTFAYSSLFFAIGFMLSRRYRLMALMLGLATTFHVLIGGWAFLAVAGWLLLRRREDFRNLFSTLVILLIYFVSSAWAIYSVLQHLLEPGITESIQASYIYVFLRSPHHLNPLSWELYRWIILAIYSFIFFYSVKYLKSQAQSQEKSVYQTRLALAELTLMTLIPFILGIAIAPFDSQGRILQYYPFRVGDLMLALSTCFLLLCALQQFFSTRKKQTFIRCCIFLLLFIFTIQAVQFTNTLLVLDNFPGEEQRVNPEWKEMASWIRNYTARDALIITPPDDLDSFNWLTERATVAQFKHIPPTSSSVIMWYERLNDLSGNVELWNNANDRTLPKYKISEALTQGYKGLSTIQVAELLKKYQANYILTYSDHQLNLPIAHANSRYTLYERL